MDEYTELYQENYLSDQEDFGELEVIKPRVETKDPKGMHSEAHALAKELSELCNEPKRFGLYLGAIKRIGVSKAYFLLSQLKDPRSKIKYPARWFMWNCKKLST